MLTVRFLRTFVVLSSVLAVLCLQRSANAQLKVVEGEDVKIFFLNDWIDATVVETKGKRVLCEYSFASSLKQAVYDRKQIRRLYEFNGLDYGRMWESASGTFEIEASLLRFKGDEITLINPDLDELKVPLASLSKKDIRYVEKFRKQYLANVKRGLVPAATPDLPDVEVFDGSAGFTMFNEESENTTVDVGAIPSFLKEFKQAGYGFNKIRDDQKLIAVIPVGGPDQLVLMSFRERNVFNKESEKFQSQLYWVSLKKKKVVNFVSITHEDYAIDYDPKSRLLLTFNRQEDFLSKTDNTPDNYTVWSLKAGEAAATPIIRFQAQGMGWADSQFGKIVNKQIVLIKAEKDLYEAYDIKNKKMAYALRSNSFFGAPVVITHDRRHLIIPEDGQVSIADAATGEFLMTKKVKERHCSGANVNQDGTKLAALTEKNIYVWNLKALDEEPKIYAAPLIGSPFKSRIDWIDDDHILGESASSRVLYRLSLKLPVWSYQMDVRQYFLNRDPLKNMVVGGMYFYVAEPDPFGGSIAVGAVSLPGPGVDKIAGDIDRKSLLLMKAGTKIRIEMDSVTQESKVKGWLKDKIENNDWVLDPSAELVLKASMGQSPRQTVIYEEFGFGGKQEKVTFTPHYANLKILNGEQIVWQTGTSTHAPHTIRARNAQREVEKYQKPRIEFFRDVVVENEIIAPEYSRGFGLSKLGLRGIEVVSTSPPGREDDPAAEAAKAEEDKKKFNEESKNRSKDGTDGNGETP